MSVNNSLLPIAGPALASPMLAIVKKYRIGLTIGMLVAGAAVLAQHALDPNATLLSAFTSITNQTTSNASVAGIPDQTPVSLAADLPAHDPSIGKLAGQASSEGGAASYHISIVVPPGRRGMQPDVSLSYNSRAGNGVAGMGWSLSGLSSLRRCPLTIEQDGMIGAVSMTDNDKLCLDGQRLVTTSGTYGQVNATYDTELESFMRITQRGGNLASTGTYFEVERRSGEILYYGNNSPAANAARVVPGGVTAPVSWMLVRKEDRTGNFMRYSYTNFGSGEVLLSDIFYTGFATTDGDRSVHFTYQARPAGATDNDQSSSFIAGGLTMQTQRLSAISTWSGVSTNSNNEVREYQLTYRATTSQSTHRSLLASVTECGFLSSQSVCRPPTTFAWQQGPMQNVFHPATLSDGTPMSKSIGDLDGDGVREVLGAGYSEIASLNADRTEKALLPVPTGTQLALSGLDKTKWNADFDQDGRTDLLTFDSNGDVVINFWDGPHNAATFAQAFTRSWNTGIQVNINNTQAPPIGSASLVYVGDVDGDGRPDIVLERYLSNSVAGSCAAQLEIYHNVRNPSGPSASASFPLLASSCLAGNNPTSIMAYETIKHVQDLNGDGLPDFELSYPEIGYATYPAGDILYSQNAGSYHLLRASFASLFPSASPATSDELNGASWNVWIDVNGDGLKDYLHLNQGGSLDLRLNVGNGLGNPIAISYSNNVFNCNALAPKANCDLTWTPDYVGIFEVADIDGDGRDELLIPQRLAAAVCVLSQHYSGGALRQYYGCPPDPATGQLNNGWFSNIGSVFNLYSEVHAPHDPSAYGMDALRFVQTGPNTFRVIQDQTSRINTYATSEEDYYGEGLNDSLSYYGIINYPYNRLGTGAGAPTTFPGGYSLNSLGDFLNENRGPGGQMNPDGKTPELPDLLAMVTDGMGVQTVWTYYPLSSNAGRAADQTPLYTIPSSPSQKYVDDRNIYFASSLPVVSEMATSDGIGGFRSLRYGYSQAMYNEQGRGFVGFRTIIQEDATSGLRTTTTFNQKFPLTSQPAQIVVSSLKRAWNDYSGPITTQVFTWRCNLTNRADATACTPPNGAATVKFPYLDTQETWTYDAAVADTPSGAPPLVSYRKQVAADDSTCAGGLSTASGYDANGNLTANTALSYDGTGANGFRAFVASHCVRTRTSFVPDVANWWLDKVNARTVTTAIAYDGTNHPLPAGVANPAQSVTTNYTWNADRTPDTETVQPGVANQQRVTTYGYPASNYGLPNSVSITASGDPNGTRTVSTTYSADGYFPQTVSNPLLQTTTTLTRPEDGQPSQVTNANGLRTVMQYDAFGFNTRTQYRGVTDGEYLAPDKTMSLSWCPASTCPTPVSTLRVRVATVQDGAPSQYTHQDQLGRTVSTSTRLADATWSWTAKQYDALGHVVSDSQPYRLGDPVYATQYSSYDILGRPAQKVTPQANQDSRGNLVTNYIYSGRQTQIQVCGSADPDLTKCLTMSRITDSLGRYMQTIDANGVSTGGSTQFWYDGSGNAIAIKDANNSVIAATYNAIGQRTAVNDPNQGAWSFGYNALGEVLSQTDARSITTTSSYDPLGRPVQRAASYDYYGCLGTCVYDTVTDTFNYDGAYGKGLEASNERRINGVLQRTVATTYDQLSRPIAVAYTNATGTANVFNALTQETSYDTYYGRPKGKSYGNAEAVWLRYSNYGHAIRESDATTTADYRMATAFDARGNAISETLAGGTLSAIHNYLPQTGQVGSIRYGSISNSSLRKLDYAYDVFGNLKQQALNTNQSSETYTYDAVQRLANATRTGAATGTVAYNYDAVGNFIFKSDFSANPGYSYSGGSCGGGPNAVKSVNLVQGGSRTYCYDAVGNMTRDSSGLAIRYDHTQRPTQITRFGVTRNFVYDAQGERFWQYGGGQSTQYFPGVERRYGIIADEKTYVGSSVVVTGSGSARHVDYLLTDRLGSVDAVANANGVLTETRGYDAFGKPRTGTWADAAPPRLGTTTNTPHGFTGHEHLDNVELIHMNGRVYDYNIGRFTGVDPVIQFPLNSQSLNPYSYIMNNPLSGTDPTGYAAVRDCLDGFCTDKLGETTLPPADTSRLNNGASTGQGTSLPSLPTATPNGVARAPEYNWFKDSVAGRFLSSTFGDAAANFNSGTNPLTHDMLSPGELQDAKFGAMLLLLPEGRAEKAIAGEVETAVTSLREAAAETKFLVEKPFPNAGGKIVSFQTTVERVFYRVFSGENTRGDFLTSRAPGSRARAIEGLALPIENRAENIQQVIVPAGTQMQRSRALPAFGRRGGLEQFQLMQQIPDNAFEQGVPFK